MSTLLRTLALLLSGALLLAPAACDVFGNKDDSEDDDKKKKKKKKGDDDDEDEDEDDDKKGLTDDDKKGKKKGGGIDGPVPASAPVNAGAILEYMPNECPKGRMYADFAALLADPAAQSTLREITTKLLSKERDPETQKAVEVLKKSGFDLSSGIREVVACVGMSDNDHVFGVALSVGDPLKLLSELVASAGQPALQIKDQGGAKVVELPGGVLVQPAPGLLIFGAPQKLSSILAKSSGPAYSAARGQVAYLAIADDGSNVEAKITRAGDSFNLYGAIQFPPDKAAEMQKDPGAVEQEIRKGALQQASELKNGPFAMLEQRVQNATFKVQGDKVVANMSVPTSNLTDLLKAAAPQLGVQLGGGSTSPAPGPGPAPQPTATGKQVDPLDELLKMMKKRNG